MFYASFPKRQTQCVKTTCLVELYNLILSKETGLALLHPCSKPPTGSATLYLQAQVAVYSAYAIFWHLSANDHNVKCAVAHVNTKYDPPITQDSEMSNIPKGTPYFASRLIVITFDASMSARMSN